jgi:RND family efflux transporter MFP subunit
MNEIVHLPLKESPERPPDPAVGRVTEKPQQRSRARRRSGGWLFGLGALLALVGALYIGATRYRAEHREVIATSEQRRDFVPSVRVATVRASDADMLVTLPATTAAFAAANLFARVSGYVEKRYVDIGDRVKAGQLLAEISGPELDHQIAQAQATLVQLQAALRQAQANRDLANVTNERDSKLVKQGWVTLQQGDTDRLNLAAQQGSVGVAQANIAAQEAQLRVLNQQKAYQSVVAPFDGVITQRNIDIGSLVQADAASGTFMFNIMQSNVIRIQVFVPQDAAFGVSPGVAAVVRIPEIPDRTFPGKVTRIADALQPGTRTLLTEIDVPNPDGAVSPGSYCTVELHIPRKTPSLIVPADAIIFDGGGLHVAVLEDGTARIRQVSVARDFGTNVEVRDGIKSGDRVILNPPVDLTEGSKVRALPEPAAKKTGRSDTPSAGHKG